MADVLFFTDFRHHRARDQYEVCLHQFPDVAVWHIPGVHIGNLVKVIKEKGLMSQEHIIHMNEAKIAVTSI